MSHPHFSKADLLCQLPECVSASVFATWLSQKELAYLDSAYCNWERRTWYLGLLGTVEFIVESKVNSQNAGELLWISQRRIRISNLEINGTVYPECENLLKLSGKSIRKLVLYRISGYWWPQLGEFCTNVVEVKIEQCAVGQKLLLFVTFDVYNW